MAAGGILGALAASSCCIVPLALFGLGVSGAWIGNLTRLAPYQPCFIVATLGFLGAGYWLVFRDSKTVGADGESCAHPWPNRLDDQFHEPDHGTGALLVDSSFAVR